MWRGHVLPRRVRRARPHPPTAWSAWRAGGETRRAGQADCEDQLPRRPVGVLWKCAPCSRGQHPTSNVLRPGVKVISRR